MAEILDYRRRLPGLARAAQRRKARSRWVSFALMLLAFVLSAGAVSLLLDAAPIRLPAAATPGIAASFPLCRGGVRTTCVVDGDTFWLEGEKYRIADIDTPEVSSPRCAAEKALGERATQRLAELLSAAPFTFASADRDVDRYGRKLRLVLRDGASLGDSLVGEGLAHRWDGGKHSWCS